MDEITKEKLSTLVELFSIRDQTYNITTEEIANLVGPTVFEALYIFFGVQPKSVAWLEIQLVNRHILIIASVDYKADDIIPEEIRALAPTLQTPSAGIPTTEEGSVVGTTRLLTVAVPLLHAFKPKEEIVQYLRTNKKPQTTPENTEIPIGQNKSSMDTSVPINVPDSEKFDEKQLTKEQLTQVLYFQQQTKGVKH